MLRILLRDRDPELVAQWQDQFAGCASVETSHGDIFGRTADAIVSPANSFGYMDGGIDLVYIRRFGWSLQDRLQAHLKDEHFGELPVGQATIVATGEDEIRLLVSAPTMRLPQPIPNTINVYLAFRAALVAILRHNISATRPVESLLVPGLGTGIGRVPASSAARQMKLAYEAVIERAVDKVPPGKSMWVGHPELLALPGVA